MTPLGLTMQPSQTERPPPGLQRGIYPTPPWVVIGLGTALVLGIVGFFLTRWLLARRRAQLARVMDSVAPPSTPPSAQR